jgi:Flp pilus assembly pilin Flp
MISMQIWLRGTLEKLVETEEGQDMIEYALLITLITIPLIFAIVATGPFIQNSFQDVANSLAAPSG